MRMVHRWVAVLVVVLTVIIAQQIESAEKTVVASAPVAQSSLQEKLNQRIDLKVVEMPLKDVFLFLQRETGIQFVLQLKKIEEASISADTPITKSLKQVRLKTVLELMLKDLELSYAEKDGLLLITTPEDAESRLETRIFDCRDLLAMPAPQLPGGLDRIATPSTQGANPDAPAATKSDSRTIRTKSRRRSPESELGQRIDQLTHVITSSIQPDSWSEVGGPGAIASYNGLFIVDQTMQVQHRIEQLLNLLREAADLKPRAAKVVRE